MHTATARTMSIFQKKRNNNPNKLKPRSLATALDSQSFGRCADSSVQFALSG